jgi:hypothetical protein
VKRALRIAEIVAEVALGLTLAALLLHLWTPLANPLGLWARTGLSMLGWWAAERMDHVPLLGSLGDGAVLLEGLILSAIVVLPALALRPPDETGRAARGLRIGYFVLAGVAVLPVLLGLLSLIAFGGGLAGDVTTLLVLGLATLYPWSTWPPDPPALRPGERPPLLPKGKIAFAVGVPVGAIAFLYLHVIYVSGPGIQPLPISEGLPAALSPLLQALPDGPVVRTALRVLFAAGALIGSVLLQRRGVPLLPRLRTGPVGWVAPLGHVALLLLLCAAPSQLLDVWRCPDLEADGPVRLLVDEPGTFQLAVVDDGRQLWTNLREQRRTLRIDLPGGGELPPIDWEQVQRDSWPEELIPLPNGQVWVGLVAPAAGDQTLMAVVDAASGRRSGSPFIVPRCYVASWTWLPRGRLLVGCEYAPEFLVIDPATRDVEERWRVPGLGSVEELVHDPQTGLVYAVPLWFGPWLSGIDPAEGRAVRSRWVGDFNWGATLHSEGGTVWLTRFHEGRILEVDLEELSISRRFGAPWSARAILQVQDRWLITAGTYSGRIEAVDLEAELSRRKLRVGGLVRSLAADGERLYYGGRCGIHAVDLDGWLGEHAR